MSENQKLTPEQEAADAKKLKQFKVLYPAQQALSSSQLQYTGTYANFLYTNVFMFSVTFTAAMTLASQLVGWLGGPIFAAFMDRFQFKNGKFWPWLAIGTILTCGLFMLIFALPAMSSNPQKLAPLVFALVMCTTIFGPLASTPINGAFPRLSKTPEDRQYFAMAQKIGRDGGKTIWGYVIPALMPVLAAATSQNGAYAIMGVICLGLPILGNELFALVGLKGSYIEREAIAETNKAKAEKVGMGVIFKVLFSNRPLLGAFFHFMFHKSYYFIYTSNGVYVFTYLFENPLKLSIFFTVFNLTAIIGVMFGKVLTAIFKDSKKSHVACYVIHMIFLAAIAVTLPKQNVNLFIILFGCSSFFMGMLENWIMPSFAAASDYAAWKTGSRMDAFVMSIYGLSVTGSLTVTTLVSSAILNSVHYTEFVASGAAVTETIKKGMVTLYGVAPLVISCVSLAFLLFVYNLNDKKINAINADLAAGHTMKDGYLDLDKIK